MKEGDNCPICLKHFDKEVKLKENVHSKSIETRLVCPYAPSRIMDHMFSYDGKLFKKFRTSCPECGHRTGWTKSKFGFSCHICGHSVGRMEEKN